MITFTKQMLIYNKTTPFNLSSLNSMVKGKIEKIFRINPTTKQSYQVWSPSAGVLQFSSLSCGQIYVIESNTINFNLTNDNSDDGLISFNKTTCI